MDNNQKQEARTIITEFNITPVRDKHSEYLEEYTTCCLCGSELEFSHVTNFIMHQVAEQAHCSTCSIDHINQSHTLQ
ncbi:MAG: hypothetical protein HOO06_07960 [Bdellovibrionaceae bacterium]|jgi:hypothetical protein|nr:hypothetical protein [Pseudobdellovibrionaceae bacterium]